MAYPLAVCQDVCSVAVASQIHDCWHPQDWSAEPRKEVTMSYEPKPGIPFDEIDTPALLLDLEAFERNVERMARYFSDKPVSLRPHAKTHKCPQVALRQLAAGAIGITCAKVSEAAVMASAGVTDLLIANEIVSPTKINRLMDLARTASLMVAVDDPVNVLALSQACAAKGVHVRVLVDVDVGMGRCGVLPGEPAVVLAHQIANAPGLEFAGILAYEGHVVMTPDPQERAQKVRDALAPLVATCETLKRDGLPAQIVSGGGTGTYDMTGTCPPITEVEAGSYVFMDTTYLRIRPEFESSLTVLSTVVSRPAHGRVVTDAGMKAITKEFGWPLPLDVPGASFRSLSEEHGTLLLEDPSSVRLRPGDKVRFIPSHCCTTVNLYDKLHVVRRDALVDVWPISARGCAQ
jgi:D-serine deaminase-like pyridoxal phosphate-dependent protein